MQVIKEITAQETKKPAKSLMDLDRGKLESREAIQIFGIASIALIVASLGSMVLWGALFLHGGISVLLGMLGLAFAILGILFSVIVSRLAIHSWYAYENRLADWHDVTLGAYQNSDGTESTRIVRQWDLSSDDFRDVVLVALSIQDRVNRQINGSHWSTRQIEGKRTLSGADGKSFHVLGDVSSSVAESMPKIFESLKIIEGRSPGKAGKWIPSSYDDLIERISSNWYLVGR